MAMQMIRISLVGLALVAASCAQPIREPLTNGVRTLFEEGEARELLAPGTSTIKGSAFARQRGGGIVTCAGKQVFLIPGTFYAQERLGAIYRTPEGGPLTVVPVPRFVPDPPAYRELTRSTKCDAQGSFQFDNVKGGRFFVVTEVAWEVSGAQQGGFVMQKVQVKDGTTETVVISF